ncbi:MAG: HNH endonuclease [Bacteroidia bacterium]
MAKKSTTKKAAGKKSPAKKAVAKKTAVKKSVAVRSKKATGKPIANLAGEQWKKMLKSDRPYMISSYGRVKSYYYDHVNGTLVNGKNVNGYLAMDLVNKGVRRMHYIHYITAEHFIKKPAYKKAVVIHLDWNKLNNRIKNLQWAKPNEAFTRTAKQNQKLTIAGVRVTLSSKLTRDQVVKIKQSLKKGSLQSELAKKFKISEMQISRIANGKSWAYVKV